MKEVLQCSRVYKSKLGILKLDKDRWIDRTMDKGLIKGTEFSRLQMLPNLIFFYPQRFPLFHPHSSALS